MKMSLLHMFALLDQLVYNIFHVPSSFPDHTSEIPESVIYHSAFVESW